MVMKAFFALESEAGVGVVCDDQAIQLDLTALQVADAQASQNTDDIQTAAGAVLSLESVAGYLAGGKCDALTASGVRFANIAIEGFCQDARLEGSNLAFSMELYQSNPTLALEGALDSISGKIGDIWKYIKDKLVAFFRWLAEKMDYFKRNAANMDKKIQQLESMLGRIDKGNTLKPGALKPAQCFVDLIYLDTGFPASGKGIMGEVDALLKAHGKIFSDVIADKIKWIRDNHAAAKADVKVFDSLTADRADFLMLNAKEMNRTIGQLIPESGNTFYRSKELPGGRAIYTEIEPEDKSGVLAIDMLAKIKVHFARFDPVSYDVRALEVAQQTQQELDDWYESLPPEVKEKTFPPYINTEVARIPGTGRRVQIREDMVFDTLSLDNIKKRLQELKDTLAQIREWYDIVFGEIWKDKSFDYLANSIVNDSDKRYFGSGAYVNPAPKYLAGLVIAIINLMSNATENAHVYAFTTSFSMLNYVERSLKQYAPKSA